MIIYLVGPAETLTVAKSGIAASCRHFGLAFLTLIFIWFLLRLSDCQGLASSGLSRIPPGFWRASPKPQSPDPFGHWAVCHPLWFCVWARSRSGVYHELQLGRLDFVGLHMPPGPPKAVCLGVSG